MLTKKPSAPHDFACDLSSSWQFINLSYIHIFIFKWVIYEFMSSNPPKTAPTLAPLKTILWRGWRKKCPQCGQGQLYKRWLTMNETCSSCGLNLKQDPGDLLGPLMFFDRALFLIPLVTIFCFLISNPKPWMYILGGGIVLYAMVATMPNRNGASVAFDYYIRKKNTPAADEPDSAPSQTQK